MNTEGNGKKMHTVLVVDDDEFNLMLARKILAQQYSVLTAVSGKQALDVLEERMPDLILLDLHMSEMDGKETMERIRQKEHQKRLPIIFLTADTDPRIERDCLMAGASDFIVKPFEPTVMMSRVSRTIELYELQNDLEAKLMEKTKQVEQVSLDAIMAIANTIDAKDAYTAGHSYRVAKCCDAIAERLEWDDAQIRNLHYIALLHDIGKIGVPDTILNKPRRLTDEEFAIVKKHPVIGGEILKDIYMVESVAEGALYHHERYDGKGYPKGLAGEEIPLCARIIGVADAYDAMTSNRVYEPRKTKEEVIAEFQKGRGTQFDPHLVDVFVEMVAAGFRIPDGDEEAAS